MISVNKEYKEGQIKGLINRALQLISRICPGARSLRVLLNRVRGVQIGNNCWIGYDTIIETSRPHLVKIGNNVIINMRVCIIAHFHDVTGVEIENDVYIGPGTIILPNVKIGKGAVIFAGSVVSSSIPPFRIAQGNPARVIASCSTPLGIKTSMREFYKGVRPIRKKIN